MSHYDDKQFSSSATEQNRVDTQFPQRTDDILKQYLNQDCSTKHCFDFFKVKKK